VLLVLALDEREGLDERDRRRLDREIGARRVEAGERDERRVLRRWLEEAPSAPLRDRFRRVRASLGLLSAVLAGLGLFFGWASASALLQLEVHDGRVNIVLCVGLLVVVPLLLLGLAGLGAVWSARVEWGEGPLGRGGWRRWAFLRAAMAVLPEAARRDAEVVLGRVGMGERLYARVRRAQLFVWSQILGLAFAAGALAATLAFVVFTDLAFGWSTTLDVDASLVHRMAATLAGPWQWLWPGAVPSLDLVETTRYFRIAPLNDSEVHFIDPIRFGGWWPFLVMALAVYALVPRCLALGFGWLWLGRECGRALAETPGVDRLLERLTTPTVETRAEEAEGGVGHAPRGTVVRVKAEEWLDRVGGSAPWVIGWAEPVEDDALFALLGTDRLQIRDAGGRRTLEEDAERIAEIAAGQGGVGLCVRAYEPPVLEVIDFLADLRAAVGPRRELIVWLLGGVPEDHAAWAHQLVILGDPGLVVAALVPAEEAPG
jgi:hypothetical protein